MRTMSGSPCLHYDCSNRNSFGYCKTTVCINEYYQWEQLGSPSTTNISERVVIKPQTHADRIRAMTDEELAEELLNVFAAFYDVEWSKEMVLTWLKSPVEVQE